MTRAGLSPAEVELFLANYQALFFDGDAVVAWYAWDDLRFSISWKAYCFADDAERSAWQEHSDDLQLEVILERLVADLRTRGRLSGERPSSTDLALLIIDEYIKFPS